MLIRRNKTFEDVMLEEIKSFFSQFFDILQTKLLIKKIWGRLIIKITASRSPVVEFCSLWLESQVAQATGQKLYVDYFPSDNKTI